MDDRYILVTGGAGYIGSHTCKALSGAGYTPVTFDNLSTGNLAAVKWGPFEKGDLLNESEIDKTFEKYKFLGAIHFAAKAYVGESVQKPLKYFEGNVSTTVNLLKIMQKYKVNTIVFSSSCATYGEPDTESISEVSKQDPVNPYGYTKLVCERMIKYHSEVHNLKYAILRYFNAAGADLENEIGELHQPETHLIPLALKSALQDETFKVFGDDYKTHDGSAVRDYIHVSDLAAAHVAALDTLNQAKNSFECNLGTGIGYSVLEIMHQICAIFPKFKYKIESRRAGDPAILVADIESSKKILNYRTDNSEMTTIIRTALEWELSRKFSVDKIQ
jgi:UDP-arabinose 4-epimerase